MDDKILASYLVCLSIIVNELVVFTLLCMIFDLCLFISPDYWTGAARSCPDNTIRAKLKIIESVFELDIEKENDLRNTYNEAKSFFGSLEEEFNTVS